MDFASSVRRQLQRAFPLQLRVTVKGVALPILERLPVWRWGARTLGGEALSPFRLKLVARRSMFPRAIDLFGVEADALSDLAATPAADDPERTALVLDVPVPGAWRVPTHLRTMVRLRPLEELSAALEPELRRRIRRLKDRCETRRVTDVNEVSRLHREFFVPFARGRHQERASLVPEAELQEMAKEGWLGLTLLDGEEVGAHVGFRYELGGEAYWAARRFGYPERIFGDDRLLSDANTINAQCTLEHASSTGAQMLDFGLSPACPTNGLLQFKRRRGGELSTFTCADSVFVRVPRENRAGFLWKHPLFSIERGGIVMNVGVPAEIADAELLSCLKKLAFAGLEAVRLHPSRRVGNEMVEAVRAMFSSTQGATHGKGGARRIEVAAAERSLAPGVG